MDDIEHEIEFFFGHVNAMVDEVVKVTPTAHGLVFKRLLFIAVLAAMSRAAYPDLENKDRKRFTRFVTEFCGWPASELISLPHLVRALEIANDARFSELKEWASNKLNGWKQGNCIRFGSCPILESDPTFMEVTEICPELGTETLDICGVRLKKLSHAALLYEMRNDVVHELGPFAGKSVFQDWDFAGYVSTIDLIHNTEYWVLNYPLGFLEKLCRESVSKLKTFLENEHKSPYASTAFGPYFIDVLNKS